MGTETTRSYHLEYRLSISGMVVLVMMYFLSWCTTQLRETQISDVFPFTSNSTCTYKPTCFPWLYRLHVLLGILEGLKALSAWMCKRSKHARMGIMLTSLVKRAITAEAP